MSSSEKMPLSEAELHQMSYKEVVELAKVNGVYQKKSSKKAALIRRLSTVWINDECNGIENIDPNRTTPLTPLKEVDESMLSASDDDKNQRRLTFTKVKKATKREKYNSEVKSTDPPKRQNTFTKDDESTISKIEEEPEIEEITDANNDKDVARSPNKKVKRASRNTSSPEEKSVAPLTRQNTFTKEDDSTADVDSVPCSKMTPKRVSSAPVESPKVTRSSGSRPRCNTFTKEDESSVEIDTISSSKKTPKRVSLKPVDESPKVTGRSSAGRPSRRNTFTNELGENGVDSGSTTLVREGTFTKTPEKKKDEIPLLQLNTSKTPAPIEKLSVFQRLSAKIPLSERRSLVMTEKRASVKTQFFTPQSDKRSRLNALREARANHVTPKSVRKIIPSSAAKTPVQPVIKASTLSTKKSSVKKPPNFAEIHKRNFAKMESLLENKKRLRERAEFMSPGRQASSSIPKRVDAKMATAPPKSSGKKSNIPILQKKMEARDRLKVAMATKCPTGAVMLAKQKKILKGVRTNKRFELQLALKKQNKT
ncbi:hypothetical protein GE061_019564 [Apolygus lucorum]|uniref:Uncharacterized protein n=1 Tax=Apolygus lucorum TaxID=248454 RepID=A0A6A4JRH3_APOLU|nr:hypothetical protein GE061_019564 [Apolygus lucorum]